MGSQQACPDTVVRQRAYQVAAGYNSTLLQAGLAALENARTRSNDALMRRKNKLRFIVDADSTEDPAHGKQESVAFLGHFGKNCFHPLFAFTGEWDYLKAKLRQGNVHSVEGIVAFFDPIAKRYCSSIIRNKNTKEFDHGSTFLPSHCHSGSACVGSQG